MLATTQGIVLRSVKYGETSLVSTIFTAQYGVQSFMMKGVRAATKGRQSRAGLLQPASLLEISLFHRPGTGLQRAREFNAAYLYRNLQEDVLRNSIALFSVELLLRLLPADAPMPELFDFCFRYFQRLDEWSTEAVANFPLFFLVQCGRYLGYELQGSYSEKTPYLNLHEGAFTDHPPLVRPLLADEDAQALAAILRAPDAESLRSVPLNGATRQRLMDWYLEFLQTHTDHMGTIRSLAVLQAVLR